MGKRYSMSMKLIKRCGTIVTIVDNSFDRHDKVQRSLQDFAELRDE
jgi:hypothetical protein